MLLALFLPTPALAVDCSSTGDIVINELMPNPAGTDNDGHEHQFTVMKIKGDTVFLDGNHPLAGQDLTFDFEVVGIDAA